MDNKPLLGITMGDPAGIGPEIIAKALADPEVYGWCRPLVIGDKQTFIRALEYCGLTRMILRTVEMPEEGSFTPGVIDLLPASSDSIPPVPLGTVTAAAGAAAYAAILRSIALGMDKLIDGVVTAPINKAALHEAGVEHAGHTEIFSSATGAGSCAMMLACGDFRVVHVSTHQPLRKACALVKRDRILEVITLAHTACIRLGMEKPRIGVAGLNPHAGEGGLFGWEEIDEIIPAVCDARALGMSVWGPEPPDTIFAKAAGGHYDIAVAMYHDQGHIPIKLLGFTYQTGDNRFRGIQGVNITLGLPLIRTSVDHGTAFDIAGTGTADCTSMKQALYTAAAMSGGTRTNGNR